ncbi:MAG: Maf family protein, partial [Myxococcota bacterium]|nr:Maf family protein [Myxococcota bacterium]
MTPFARTLLVLASASPRRLELLQRVGLRPLVLPSELPEEHEEGETPEDFVLRMAREKAQATAAHSSIHAHPKCFVLAADTIVLLDQNLGRTGQAPNRQEVEGTGQAPNRQEVEGTGQAPNRQEVEGTGQAP